MLSFSQTLSGHYWSNELFRELRKLCFWELFYFRSTLNPCAKQSLESLSCLKVISSYAWQDSSGTPGWCAGTVPCSKRSRHFPPAAPWCSSPSLSVNGSTPSWAAIIHWRRSTNGIRREASLSHLRSSAFRRLGGFLWSPLTTERFCSHPASREKLRYMSTLWLIWVNELTVWDRCLTYLIW